MRAAWAVGLGIVMAAQPAAAPAQHPMVLAKLQEINAQAPQPPADQLKQAVMATARAFGDANRTCVPSDAAIAVVAPATGSRDVLQAVVAGQLRNGWTLYATYAGCPGAGPVRFLIAQKADSTLLALQVNEGRTHASPAIMRDTSMQAALAAHQKATGLDKTCDGKDMKMGPTRVAAESKDLGPDLYGVRYVGSWSEVWRFETCGRKFDVPVHFTPDGDGGAYTNIKADEVALVR
jgi:hypothetical protein